MLHIHFLRAWATSHVEALHHDSERGSTTTETVIMTAIMAGLALSVGAIIVAAVIAKANSISLN